MTIVIAMLCLLAGVVLAFLVLRKNPALFEAFSAARVAAESDVRVVNNVMRHEYRVLSDDEKALMLEIKDKGRELHELLARMGVSRELALARTKVEEGVMWAVKHLTA